MTGAESLLQTLVANEIEVCFMNPGTSEMHFVSALDKVAGMRGILCLYEGVCSGAADGYARMKGSPAAALLHLGPGLGNSLSNFHNARKARTPIVAIVGEHSTAHLKYDAPLTADIGAFARTVSQEIRTVMSATTVGATASATIAAAIAPPGQIAVLIVPADYSWLPSETIGATVPHPTRERPKSDVIEAAARILCYGKPAAIVLGGSSINRRALDAAARLSAATGVRFFADRTAPRLASGRGFAIEKIPYFPEDASKALAGLKNMILVESQTPVSFFGYPDTPGSPVPDSCTVSTLATRAQDGTAALEALVLAVDAKAADAAPAPSIAQPEPLPEGPLNLHAIGKTIAALMPENSIVSDEMVSSSAPVLVHLLNAPPHDQLTITGGAIGQGLPVAVGAAVACPDRKVLALEADGSAMYSLQALWTMARENLDVTVVIFANHRYRILDIEMKRTGAQGVGKSANDMLDLGRPNLDFVSLSHGMGVPATRATTAEEFTAQFREAVAVRGPRLIEAVL
ncbi:MAG TPA: acetolactate synthase large subunit [Bryobacteraceae bacterium]|jgi:acetolactate synthase-1/2/3 large subunit|nr:acetolactate synthase large subunit [Bryobacteraceae bacterium]